MPPRPSTRSRRNRPRLSPGGRRGTSPGAVVAVRPRGSAGVLAAAAVSASSSSDGAVIPIHGMSYFASAPRRRRAPARRLRRARRRRRRHEHLGRPCEPRLLDRRRAPARSAATASRRARCGSAPRQSLRHRRAGRSHHRGRAPDVDEGAPTSSSWSATLSAAAAAAATTFHRSHQSGRDVDLVYYMRDPDGKPFEPDAMHVFDEARQGEGRHRAVRSTSRDLAARQGARHRAARRPCSTSSCTSRSRSCCSSTPTTSTSPRRSSLGCAETLRQPGDSARHDDHLHVRVYCSAADRRLGCVDMGPLDLEPDEAITRAELDDVRRVLQAGTHRIDLRALALTRTSRRHRRPRRR